MPSHNQNLSAIRAAAQCVGHKFRDDGVHVDFRCSRCWQEWGEEEGIPVCRKGLVRLDDNYEIDLRGNVYSRRRMGGGGCLINHRITKDGYVRVRLSWGNKKRTVGLHRLLARAFIPNPRNLPEVNHIDGNPTNNDVSNLEWCDARHNQRHAYRIGLRKTNPKSGEKYVYWCRPTSSWRVIITNPDGTKNRLGRFKTVEDAVKARDAALSGQSEETCAYLASLLDDDPLPHQEPCNCRDCSLTDAKGTE